MGILSIDFGGTRTRAAFYTDDLQQMTRHETRSLVDQPADAVIERITNAPIISLAFAPSTKRRVIPDFAVDASPNDRK